ncbi:MAG TPA: amidohydrolase family protein, partial [Thermoanaerobaculia bacterium]|nr:amidohydrolase family protein [Thermoanaerobaculia bacterium]
ETHTHTVGLAGLRRALALGITGALVIDTGDGSPPELEKLSAESASPVPRVYLVAGRFSAEFPGRFLPNAPRFAAPTSVAEAQTAIDELAKSGVQRIKIWQDDGVVWAGSEQRMRTLAPEVVRALVSATRTRAMKVYVHAWQLQYYRQALELSPDAIIHPVMDARLDTRDLDALKSKQLPWMTTLAQLYYFGDRQGYSRRLAADPRLTAGLPAATVAGLEREAATTAFPDLAALVPEVIRNFAENLATIRENTRRASAAGVVLSVASDRPVGYGTHLEMQLIAEAGLAPLAVLKAATAGGAAALGVSGELGSITPGRIADLVLLGSDPLKDTRNLRDVRFVMKGGQLWSTDELRRQ